MVERLHRGSIVNHNLILIDDIMRVSIRSGNEGAWLAILSDDNLFEIARDNPVFERKMGFYLDNILRHGKSVVLDYVPCVFGKTEKNMKQKQHKIMLKNIVFYKIHEIKDRKTKPKLRDLFKQFRGHNKEILIEKINFLYARKEEKTKKYNKFDTLNGYFDIIKKVQLVQKKTMDEIDQKLN